MNRVIRILLVDDYEVYRHGLRRMLENEGDIEIIGDCSHAQEAFAMMARFHPDMVLMDAQMPGMNGIEAIRSLKRSGLDYGCAVIIIAESVDFRDEALKAGAASFLVRNITGVELVRAIREVYQQRLRWQDRRDIFEQAVELVIPPTANAAGLLTFMCRLEDRLRQSYSHADIAHVVGSWERGAVITILVLPDALVNLVEKLQGMPEVNELEEELLAGDALSSLPKKLWTPLRVTSSPSKRIRITLKETSFAE